MNQYLRGQTIRFTAKFYDLTDTLADPTTITLTVEDPSGTETSYTYSSDVQKTSTGIFYYDLTLGNTLGVYNYEWVGTGTVKAINEDSFRVVARRKD